MDSKPKPFLGLISVTESRSARDDPSPNALGWRVPGGSEVCRSHSLRYDGEFPVRSGASDIVVNPQSERAAGFGGSIRNSSLAQRQLCPSVEGRTRWRKTAFTRENHYRCEQMKATDSLRLQFVAGIGGSLKPVGLVDIVPAVPVVVGSRLSHAVLLASSSYDTCS